MADPVVLGHAAICDLLPQRWPMVLLDRVLAVDLGARTLVGTKAVSATEPCYRGLPDGLAEDRYAYPVSLLMESFGQAAAVLWRLVAEREPDELLMFAVARDCVIDDRVYPGDLVRHEVALENVVGANAFATGACFVDDRRVASMGSFMAVRRPAAGVLT